jgi:Skp family chaperone for outer membrane proteins
LTKISKLCFSGLIITLFFSSNALAQSKTKSNNPKDGVINVAVSYAILDVQKILRDAKAVKSIREQIAAFGLNFEAEIEKEREKLRKANQELSRQRTILAPEVFAEKRREFEQRVVDVQRIVQKRQRDLDKSRATALSEVNKTYVSIVKEIAVKRDLLMIIRKVQTAYANPDLDLTNEVLAILDKKKPTVNVVKPE